MWGEERLSIGCRCALCVCSLGRWPWNFWILHFIFMGVLLPFRYYQFREKGQEVGSLPLFHGALALSTALTHGFRVLSASQLYLLDFCYFGGGFFIALLNSDPNARNLVQ